MKFISKSTNLLIVLSPGLPAQPLTGTPAKPTISVRFKDGIADVQDEKLVHLMLAHPGFNSDFISAEDVPVDPYALSRQSSEPAHIVTEMQFGHPMKKEIKGGSNTLPPELQKLVQSAAVEMAKSMLPSMVEKTLKSLVESREKKDPTPTGEYKCQVGGCGFAGKNANGLRLHAKKHKSEESLDVLSKSAENPAVQESVS